MYYYCNRSKMSAAGPGAEGPQSCCGGDRTGGGRTGGGRTGGGGGCCELVNGNGDREISETDAIGEWESATCNSADATRKANTDGALANGAKSWKCGQDCCYRQSAQQERGNTGINIDGDGGLCSVMEAERTTRTGMRVFQKSDVAVSKRRGCSFSRASKRACISGIHARTAAVLHAEMGKIPVEYQEKTFVVNRDAGSRVEMKGMDGVSNGEKRACRTTKGRVRLYRVRSFLTASDRPTANGVSAHRRLSCDVTQPKCMQKSHCNIRARSPSALPDGVESTCAVMNGTSCTRLATESGGSEISRGKHVEEAQGEARKRQVQLEERTETLWRRLHAMQAKQVERHVTQQLGDLRKGAVTPSSADLSRLARSCSEALRTAEDALDSDHTASSSGEGSDSEEEERGGRHAIPSHVKSLHLSREWQWTRERAWLGSRWVWLQAQVSELEYRIRALTALYTHLRQGKLRAAHSVPETPLRALRPSPASNDCRSLAVGDPLRKRLTEESAPSAQTMPSPTSSAARVRPLLRQRRHRLIRLEECTALESKAVTLPCCCEPPTLCVLCAPPRPPAEKKYARMRQSGLDHCVHPVLSMPSDLPLPFTCGMPPLAGPQSHRAMHWIGEASSSWLGRRGQGSQRAGRARRRLICPRPPNTLPPLFSTSGGSNCRSHRGVISPGLFPHRVADMSTFPAPPPATDTPTQRRRRGESSFDIDNLVMPLGLAGLGARVQKLQYKEIITPSWRELDSVCGASEKHVCSDGDGVTDSDTPHQPNSERPEDDGETEDMSDAVFLKRHAIWESRERSRWGSWARRRRRGRSSSCYGDGKSCRGLEQGSCSPEPRQGKSSPCSPHCSGADDPFYQMEDEQQAVQPWERRSFPLLEVELRWLQEDEEAEPEEDACAASGRSQSTDSGISVGSLELSPRTPQPHQQHSGGRKPAASTTQDSDSLPSIITPPILLSSQLPSLSSLSTHQTQSNHRASKTNTTLL